jgi:hypothetical protein
MTQFKYNIGDVVRVEDTSFTFTIKGRKHSTMTVVVDNEPTTIHSNLYSDGTCGWYDELSLNEIK